MIPQTEMQPEAELDAELLLKNEWEELLLTSVKKVTAATSMVSRAITSFSSFLCARDWFAPVFLSLGLGQRQNEQSRSCC